jgi:hypothetical protein
LSCQQERHTISSMPRTVGLSIDSESSGCSSSSWCETDDESLEAGFWDKQDQGPPTHVWDDESPTLSPLQTPCTAALALEITKVSLPMLPSDYSSSENSSIHQPCHFRSQVIRRRIEQLEQESLSSDCDEDDVEDDALFSSRELHHHGRRRPKSWRVYLALVAITMVVLSHARPPRPFVEIRREEVAVGHLRSHSKHKLPKYFMPKFDASYPPVAAASPATATTNTDQQPPGSGTTNHANFALAQTSHASRPVFERFEFREEEEPLPSTPLSETSWTTYFAGITFFSLLVETTYKEYRAYRFGRRQERRL